MNDPKWIPLPDVVERFHLNYATVSKTLAQSKVRRVGLSHRSPEAMRGPSGIAYHRADIERLERIRRAARVSWEATVRVFDMLREDGLI